MNIGLNAYRLACAQTSGSHLIELDDDVVCAPFGWDRMLLEAYELLPDVGYLAAGIIDDGRSIAADLMFRQDRHKYQRRQVGGVTLLEADRRLVLDYRGLYDRVGGFRQHKRLVFWREDGTYIADIGELGYPHRDPRRPQGVSRIGPFLLARRRREGGVLCREGGAVSGAAMPSSWPFFGFLE